MTRNKLKSLEAAVQKKTGKGIDFPICLIWDKENHRFMDWSGKTWMFDEKENLWNGPNFETVDITKPIYVANQEDMGEEDFPKYLRK